MFRPFLYVEMPVTTCWLVLRIPWDLLAKVGDSLVDNKQFDIVLKTSTADTGAQFFLLGADHLPHLGLSAEDLLQSEINLNCANSTMAGNLGVFYAKIRGGHWETGEVIKSKTMVYVIEGNIVLVSKAVLS